MGPCEVGTSHGPAKGWTGPACLGKRPCSSPAHFLATVPLGCATPPPGHDRRVRVAPDRRGGRGAPRRNNNKNSRPRLCCPKIRADGMHCRRFRGACAAKHDAHVHRCGWGRWGRARLSNFQAPYGTHANTHARASDAARQRARLNVWPVNLHGAGGGLSHAMLHRSLRRADSTTWPLPALPHTEPSEPCPDELARADSIRRAAHTARQAASLRHVNPFAQTRSRMAACVGRAGGKNSRHSRVVK